MNASKISGGAITALVATGIFLAIVTAGLISTQSLPSSGTISAVNIGVYSDSGCTQTCTSLDWGMVSPGSVVTKNVYVKNTGNVPVTLSMATSGWSPSNANSYLTVSWNRQGTQLNAGQSIAATITLTVASDTGSLNSFSFNATLTGTE